MKKMKITVAGLVSLVFVTTVFSADETISAQSPRALMMLQQKMQSVQAQLANASATEGAGIQAIDIKGTYSGTASGMNPKASCITTPVKVTITKQCGNLAKGSITALGVTVPVTGSFKNNYLSLDGIKTGSTVWTAGLGAHYTGSNFVVGSFSFQKANTALNNRYDSGWLLKE